MFSLDTLSKQINVGKFYPELYKETESKYLSAACFYLLVHHFAHVFHLPEEYHIFIQTRPATYEKFFSRLLDFHLYIEDVVLCKTAEVCGTYPSLDIDTSMIRKRKNRKQIGTPSGLTLH